MTAIQSLAVPSMTLHDLTETVAAAFKTAVRTLCTIAADITGNPREARLAASALLRIKVPDLLASTLAPVTQRNEPESQPDPAPAPASGADTNRGDTLLDVLTNGNSPPQTPTTSTRPPQPLKAAMQTVKLGAPGSRATTSPAGQSLPPHTAAVALLSAAAA